MQNAEMTVKDNILTITIDLSKRNGLSKSGKSFSIASTEGNKKVPGHDDIKIGLNCYIKNPDYVEDKE